jgi:phosphoglycolate phosphatase-like HAD superfamily hydrolase
VYKQIADIDDLIDAETSADDVQRSKPHPDIFAAALQRLKMSRADALVVGDTPWDAIAARRLGVRPVGVLCGGFAEPDLRAAGCIAIYRDPEDMLARLDEPPLS